MDGLAEVEAGRLLDARDRDGAPLPEVDLIEVRLEDLVLAVLPLDDEREEGLDRLPAQRPLLGEEQVLDELLGERRGAARRAHPHGALDERPGEPSEREPGVRVEVAVLDREDGVLDDPRHPLEPDERPVLHLLVEDGADDLRLEDGPGKLGPVLGAADGRDATRLELDPERLPRDPAVGRLPVVQAHRHPSLGDEVAARPHWGLGHRRVAQPLQAALDVLRAVGVSGADRPDGRVEARRQAVPPAVHLRRDDPRVVGDDEPERDDEEEEETGEPDPDRPGDLPEEAAKPARTPLALRGSRHPRSVRRGRLSSASARSSSRSRACRARRPPPLPSCRGARARPRRGTSRPSPRVASPTARAASRPPCRRRATA